MVAKATAARPLDEIRQGTRRSRDPRAVRTRSTILAAVESLLAEGGSSPITVADILDRAQIGRTSFYSHFASLEEVALDIFTNAFTASAGEEASAARPFSVEMLVDHYLAHARLYRSLLKSSFAHQISMSTVAALASAIARSRSPSAPDPCPFLLPDVFWASALIGALDAWLRGVFTGSRAQILEALQDLMPREFAESKELAEPRLASDDSPEQASDRGASIDPAPDRRSR